MSSNIIEIENYEIRAIYGELEKSEKYSIFYRDGEGHWLNAVGVWNGSVKIDYEYQDEPIAQKAAELLHKIDGSVFVVAKAQN